MPRRRVTPSKGGTKHEKNLKRTIERLKKQVAMDPPPKRPPTKPPFVWQSKKAFGIYGFKLPGIRILPPPSYPPPAHLLMAGIVSPAKTDETVA